MRRAREVPQYIEDLVRAGPDAFNDNDPDGDPAYQDPRNGDWWPTIQRALVQHLTTAAGAALPKQRTYAPQFLFGRSQSEYRVSDVLHVFGAQLIGTNRWVTLDFYNGSSGVIIHYPDTGPGEGTFHPDVYDIPPALQPFDGYGASSDTVLENLRLNGDVVNGPGSRGLVIHRFCVIRDCFVTRFGWHGIHITADVNRDPGLSNANGTQIYRTSINRCGENPGSDPERVAPWRPDTRRGFGSGLRLQGGDANTAVTVALSSNLSAYAGIHDTGFLGNLHIMPHVFSAFPVGHPSEDLGGFILTQELKDIYDGAVQWQEDNPPGGALATSDPEEWARLNAIANVDIQEFWYGDEGRFAIGEKVMLAYIGDSLAARTLFLSPYTEGGTAITRMRGNTFRIAGINSPIVDGSKWEARGVDGLFTLRALQGDATPANLRKDPNIPENAPPPVIRFGPDEGTGALFQLDHGSQRGGLSQLYRFKYIPKYYDDDPAHPNGGPNGGGWYHMDSRNSASLTAFRLSSWESEVDGRSIEEGRLWFPQRTLLGARGGKWLIWGNAEPDDDAFAGDIAGENLRAGDVYWKAPRDVQEGFTLGESILYALTDVDGQGTLEWRSQSAKKAANLRIEDTVPAALARVGAVYLPAGRYTVRALAELTTPDGFSLLLEETDGTQAASAPSLTGQTGLVEVPPAHFDWPGGYCVIRAVQNGIPDADNRLVTVDIE